MMRAGYSADFTPKTAQFYDIKRLSSTKTRLNTTANGSDYLAIIDAIDGI